MAHELEQHDDQVAFIDTRTDAWHRLNNLPADVIARVAAGEPLSAEEALKHAHLADWDVRKVPAFANVGTEGKPSYAPVPGAFISVRTNPFTGGIDTFGPVGRQWTPFQNEALTEFLDALVHESRGNIETAGSLRGGREVFVTTKLPDTMTIGGVDKVDLMLSAMTSHDGTKSTRFIAGGVRIVCANTQRAAEATALATASIRHTSGQSGYVAKVQEQLGLAFKGYDDLAAEFERMIQTDQTDAEFQSLIDATFYPDGKVPTEKGHGLTLKTKRDETLMGLWADADTQANIRGTVYAGYQSVIEYLDHFAPVQGASDDAAKAAVKRAERVLSGTQDERNRVWNLSRIPA